MLRRLMAYGLALGVVGCSPMKAGAGEAVPEHVMAAAEAAGAEYGICPELLESIACEESGFNASAVNGEFQGLMQISPRWHGERMERLGVADLTDTQGAMMVAADYLAELFEEHEDVGAVLMAYGGSGKRLERYKETGELPGYAERVLERSAEYERAHGK